MSATELRIVRRTKRWSSIVQASLRDFVFEKGEPVESAIVLRDPRLSLYCVDPREQRAIFVETGDARALLGAPFFYQAQFQQAQRLIAVPYEELHRLAASVADPFAGLVFVYSTGRAGSTLISKVFQAVPSVTSVSEPDVFTQLAYMREGGTTRTEIEALVKSTTRLFLAPLHQRPNTIVVMKFRSQVTSLADVLHQAYPSAKVVFVYRNLLPVLESHDWMWGRRHARSRWMLRFPLTSQLLKRRLRRTIEKRRGWIMRHVRFEEPCSIDDWLRIGYLASPLLSTLGAIDDYLALEQAGASAIGIRYEDLVEAPEHVLCALLRACGLPVLDPVVLNDVLNKDSQAGTLAAASTRKERMALNQRDVEGVRRILRKHRFVKDLNFVLPGTISAPKSKGLSRVTSGG